MADSLHEEALDSIKATLADLALDGIPEARIHKGLSEDRTGLVYPCILLLVDAMRETFRPFSTESDERVLSVVVLVLDRQDRKNPSWLAPWLERRQLIANAILMQVPDDVEGVWHVEIEATSVIDGSRLAGKLYEDARGGFTVRMQVITDRVRPA